MNVDGTGFDVITVGETMGCFLLRGDEGTCGVTFIGAESNLAIGLVALGHRALWVSRLGADQLGDLIRRGLSDRGVAVHAPPDPDRPTGLALKELGRTATVVRYYRQGSAASAMTSEDVPSLRGARWLHLTGITPALSPSCADLLPALITDARAEGLHVSLDVNLRPVLWDSLTDAADTVRGLCRGADLIFIGEDESRALGLGATAKEFLNEVDVSEATVVFKLGADGADCFAAGEMYSTPAVPAEVVDVTGAGDAFAAGFLSGMLRRLSIAKCLELGHLMAAQVIGIDRDFIDPPDESTHAAVLRTMNGTADEPRQEQP